MKNKILVQGIVAGIAGIAFALSLYWFQRDWFMGSYANTLGWSAVIAFFMFRAGFRAQTNLDENPLSLYSVVFGVFAIACVMAHGFEYVLYNFVDPSLIAQQKTLMLEAYKKLAAIDKHSEIEAQMADFDPHNISTSFYSLLRGLLGGAVLSLMLTAVLRRVQ